MVEHSAGIILYRMSASGLRVLLGHPGGPFWRNRDDGAWSIPKGRVDPDEDLAACARREFAEETGYAPPGELVALGDFVQPRGKIVTAFALEGTFDPAALRSITFELQWPPRSGRTVVAPELDRVAWFAPDEASRKILRGQAPILGALQALVGGAPAAPRPLPRRPV